MNSAKSVKITPDELFRILRGWYQPTRLYFMVGFLSLALASFFLICAGDSAGAGYRLRFRLYLCLPLLSLILFMGHFLPPYEVNENILSVYLCQFY